MNTVTAPNPRFNLGGPLPVDPAGIPDQLKRLPWWVGWKGKHRGKGKDAKEPISARTGKPADVTDPGQLVGFDDALGFYLDRRLDGIGFAFLPDAPHGGLDLDNCRDPHTGAIDPIAAELLHELGTYAEVSPSGSGVKAIGLAKLDPAGRHRGIGIELYDRGRFFAVTGQRLPFCPPTVEPCQAALRRLQAALGPPAPPPGLPALVGGFPGSDAELLKRAFAAKNGGTIRRYWEGDRNGKPSASEALLGLGRLLAFWTGPDPDRLERLLLRSPLVRGAEAERPKWHDRRAGGTWGTRFVVARAIVSCPVFYSAPPGESYSPNNCVTLSSHFAPTFAPARNPIGQALRLVEAGQVPPGLDAITSHKRAHQNALRRLAAVVWHLAGRRAEGRCRLSVEAAARAFGVGTSSISRWLNGLQTRGVIRRTAWGNSHTKFASEWAFVGLPARTLSTTSREGRR